MTAAPSRRRPRRAARCAAPTRDSNARSRPRSCRVATRRRLESAPAAAAAPAPPTALQSARGATTARRRIAPSCAAPSAAGRRRGERRRHRGGAARERAARPRRRPLRRRRRQRQAPSAAPRAADAVSRRSDGDGRRPWRKRPGRRPATAAADRAGESAAGGRFAAARVGPESGPIELWLHTSSAIARRAGIVAALRRSPRCSGIASGVIFAYAGDLPQISALDDYAPSTISRVYGAHGEIVGEFAIQRREVIPYEAISPKLKQAILAAEDATFEQHFGLSIPRIVVTLMQGHHRAAQGRRRQHADPAARPQAVPDRRKDLGAEDQGGDPRHPDREALHEARDLHALLQPDVLRPRRLRREAASRLYFGKSAKDLTLDEAALIAGILQGNVRQSPYVNMDAALRRRNYALDADGGGRLHHRRRSGGRRARSRSSSRGEPPRQASVAPYFLEEVRKELEAPLRRQAALRERPRRSRPRSTSRCRRPPTARWTTGCGGSTSGAASASRAATSSPKATPIETFKHPRWDRPMRDGDIVPAVVTGVDGAAIIDARAGALRVTIDQQGLRLDRQDDAGAAGDAPAI